MRIFKPILISALSLALGFGFGPQMFWLINRPVFPYTYQRQITVNNSSGGVIATGYSVSYTFDHAALVAAGKSLASGADVRVYYYNGSTFAEINRAIDLSAGWNTSTTKIWFSTQASIANSGTDNHYYLYYGKSNMTIPTYDWHNITALSAALQQSQAAAYTAIGACRHQFTSDATAFWYAGTTYPWSFASDTWLAMTSVPEQFSADQINNIVVKFVAAKNGNGELPMALNADATANTFYSAADGNHVYATGDAIWTIPQMALLAYQKNGSLTTFNSVSSSLKAALQRIPRDVTSHLVYVPAGTTFVPWGFEENVNFDSEQVLMGSLYFYQSAKAMKTLYAAAGDTTNASLFDGYMTDIAASLDAAFWSATDGMYHAATGSYNNQIDGYGSAFAVSLGLAPTHATAISTYLASHYSSMTYQGFWRISNVNWQRQMGYWADQPGFYIDGYWSIWNNIILSTVALTSPSTAQTAIADFISGTDLAHEWYNIDHSSGGSGTASLSGPAGSYAFVEANPSLFVGTGTTPTADYSGIFALWDDLHTFSSAWSASQGTWSNKPDSSGVLQQTSIVTGSPAADVKLVRDVGLSDGLLLQVDFLANSYNDTGNMGPGACISSLDAGTSSRGYCFATQSSNRTQMQILNERIAWGDAFSFPTTTGVWYREQIARSGSTIYAKIWVRGDAEPAWQTTYTQSTNLAYTGVSLHAGNSPSEFDNLLVRKFTPTEPTTSAGSEVATHGRQAP